ncbi:MAG: hypothetical protein K9H26_19180 [Prolixibacteraceae bacterium]|nr:hypothetical protein [Prolixibacteraceae bacterium]
MIATIKLLLWEKAWGGLVARYALSYMESNGEDHNTRLFMTMDTPHQGAYVSYAVQHLGKIALDIINFLEIFGVDFSEALGEEIYSKKEDVDKMFNATSSQQMLVYYRPDCVPEFPEPSPVRTQFLNDIDRLGINGYPGKVDKMVAFSFGSGKGADGTQGFDAGETRYSYNGPQEILGVYFDNLNICTKAIPDNESLKIIDIYLEKKFPAPCIPHWPIFNFLCGHGIVLKLQLVDLTVEGTLSYENAPGGFFNLATAGMVEVLDGLLHTNVLDNLKNDCFVPTVSSLDLKNKPLVFDIRNFFTGFENYYEVNDHSITPFDAFYVEEENKEHGKTGTTDKMIKRAFELIIGDDDLLLKDLFITDEKAQYEAAGSITLDNVHASSNPSAENAALHLRAGKNIIFEKDFSIEKSCTFEVVTQGFCE